MKEARVGVGVIVLDGRGRVLMGRRNPAARRSDGKFGDGWEWSLPGGALEFGEEFEECAIREVKEETNLDIRNPRLFCAQNNIDELAHWVNINMWTDEFSGAAAANEPDKYCEWKWVAFDELPDKIFFPSARAIQAFRAL